MSVRARIALTAPSDATWNVVSACSRVSPERDNDFDGPAAGGASRVRLHAEQLTMPLILWYMPRRIFVGPVADMFHDDVPDDYIAHVFAVMALASRHTFQVLTEHPDRMRPVLRRVGFTPRVIEIAEPLIYGANSPVPREERDRVRARIHALQGMFTWPLPNVWLGIDVENQELTDNYLPAQIGTPSFADSIESVHGVDSVTVRTLGVAHG